MLLRGETGSASWIGVGGEEGPEKQQVKTRKRAGRAYIDTHDCQRQPHPKSDVPCYSLYNYLPFSLRQPHALSNLLDQGLLEIPLPRQAPRHLGKRLRRHPPTLHGPPQHKDGVRQRPLLGHEIVQLVPHHVRRHQQLVHVGLGVPRRALHHAVRPPQALLQHRRVGRQQRRELAQLRRLGLQGGGGGAHGGALGLEAREGGFVLGARALSEVVEGVGELVEEKVLFGIGGDGRGGDRGGGGGGDGEGEVFVEEIGSGRRRGFGLRWGLGRGVFLVGGGLLLVPGGRVATVRVGLAGWVGLLMGEDCRIPRVVGCVCGLMRLVGRSSLDWRRRPLLGRAAVGRALALRGKRPAVLEMGVGVPLRRRQRGWLTVAPRLGSLLVLPRWCSRVFGM